MGGSQESTTVTGRVTGKYYRDNILAQIVEPFARLSGRHFVFRTTRPVLTGVYWSLLPSSCQAHCLAEPSDIAYSSFSSRLTQLDRGVTTSTFWCSAGAVFIARRDLAPSMEITFKDRPTVVGVGIQGPPTTHKQYGFPFFQVYNWVGINMYEAIREGNVRNRRIKTFPGLTAQDIERGALKDHMFPYPVVTNKLKIFFKLRLGHDKVCLKIQFYQNPEACDEMYEEEDKCRSDNGGCQHICKRVSVNSFYCTCWPGYTLWRNGLNCVPDYQIKFHLSDRRQIFEVAQAECFHRGGVLSTLFSKDEYVNMTATTPKWADVYYIGVVDVDHDQSYSRWIDGSDVVFSAFSWTHANPGSTGMSLPDLWITDYHHDAQLYSCRISNEDSYLVSGYHGIQDFQLTSSPYLTLYSTISAIAFGHASSRRGSKAYIKTDTGLEYGSMWRPN
ncbi:uncharacterized protein LOC121383788 [Gigantopelta aegis]|uniref:uncharacterized protein LOC121383788 n=1 Tax=Gigantopelta aegis TaxID=1735272 RepID=UPI001B88DA9B|nr:uncharacterized protein LOC121383788 [Gigantopelta aegis]